MTTRQHDAEAAEVLAALRSQRSPGGSLAGTIAAYGAMAPPSAVEPERREKHFEVIRVLKEEGAPLRVVLRALISKAERTVPARELEEVELWAAGWL